MEDVKAPSPYRDVYVPLKPNGSVQNPLVQVEPPPPGVLVFRFEESFLYPNAAFCELSSSLFASANFPTDNCYLS